MQHYPAGMQQGSQKTEQAGYYPPPPQSQPGVAQYQHQGYPPQQQQYAPPQGQYPPPPQQQQYPPPGHGQPQQYAPPPQGQQQQYAPPPQGQYPPPPHQQHYAPPQGQYPPPPQQQQYAPPPQGQPLQYPPPPPQHQHYPQGQQQQYAPPPPQGQQQQYAPPPPQGQQQQYAPPPPQGQQQQYAPPPPQGQQQQYAPPPQGQQQQYAPPPQGQQQQYAPPPQGQYPPPPQQQQYAPPPQQYAPPQGQYPPPPQQHQYAPPTQEHQQQQYPPPPVHNGKDKSHKNKLQGAGNLLPQSEVSRCVSSIRSATHGVGTDEAELISVVSKLPRHHLKQVSDEYQRQYSKSLLSVFKSETSGNFQNVLEDLCYFNDYEYDAYCLRNAMEGTGKDIDEMLDVLVGRTNAEYQGIASAYRLYVGRDLVNDLKKELRGDVEFFFLKLIEGVHQNQAVDPFSDAQSLYKAGEKKFGTDEKTFILILTCRPAESIVRINESYMKQHGKGLETVLKKEFSGDLLKGLSAVVKCALDNPGRIAEAFRDTMEGLGTDDGRLRRLVVRYSKSPLLSRIKSTYERQFQKSLLSSVESDTSGDYKKLLSSLLQH